MIEQGLVHNRYDVLAALKDSGLAINRAGKDIGALERLVARQVGKIRAEAWQPCRRPGMRM